MDLTIFENLNGRRISPEEAKRILNRNGNAYSDEEVKKIVDFLYALAELEAEYAGKTGTERTHLILNRNDSFVM